MGLIAAGLNAVGGTLASQWKEYFYVDALPDDVLVTKAGKKVKGRFGGSRYEDDNVISDGSVIAVNDGQCMMIVDQGRIVDFCAEPGEYVFDQNGEPSIFYGELNGEKLKAILKTTFDRLSFGGQAGRDTRVYFFNTKEIIGNKYGTPSTVPFRVVDSNIGLDMDVSIRCFGEYSYRITNPMLFYVNVCGNVEGDYTRDGDGHSLQCAAGSYDGDRSGAQRRALGEVGQSARRGDRVLRREFRQGLRRGRGDDQGASAQRRVPQRQHGGGASGGRAGTGHAGRSEESGRRVYRLHGHEHGAAGRRHERSTTVPDGRAAAGSGTAARLRAPERQRVEMCLRRDGHGQILPRMRREKARSRGLDVRLRCGQQGQILLGMRGEAPVRRAAIPLR